MLIMVLLTGNGQNSKLFWHKRDDAEAVAERIAHDFKQGDLTAIVDIRDDFGGRTVIPLKEWQGCLINETTSNEDVAAEIAVSNAMAQVKTNNRVQTLAQLAEGSGRRQQ